MGGGCQVVQSAQNLRQLTGGELACSACAVRVGRETFLCHEFTSFERAV